MSLGEQLLADHSRLDSSWSGRNRRLTEVFGAVLLIRLLYPFFNSPLTHLYSDPLRHWQTGLDFLHPDVMGGGDPFLYQFWLFCLRSLAGNSEPVVLAATGALCAAMPYGWYRALRELLPRDRALLGAIAMGLIPGFLGVYGFFMTESLLLTLTGFAFWMTLRAARKRTLGAFAAAVALWLAASYTRIVVLPMAGACLAWLWLAQGQKLAKAAVGLCLVASLTIPAGLHARAALGYFAPLGNLYLNAAYHDSGAKDIAIDYGANGHYVFGSASYYNATFYPFSDWLTSRSGTVSIAVDPRNGRANWIQELERVRAERRGSAWRDRWENLLYLLFSQEWPDTTPETFVGSLTLASRWLWVPLVAIVVYMTAKRRFRGHEWLLPACGLMSFVLLALQSQGIMEGRFRKPIEPVFVAALTVACCAKRREPAR